MEKESDNEFMLTELDIIEQQAKIKHALKQGDYEVAHQLEDELFEEFAKHISAVGDAGFFHCGITRKKALMVLETKKIDFPRFTA